MEKGKADRGLGITARLWDSSLIQNSASEGFQIGQRSEMKGAITMKKLMIAATAAFCATVGLAIESANIVGYASKAVPANTFVQAGAQFFDVASDTLALDKVMSGLEGVDYDEEDKFTATAPHIQIPGADGIPAKYYYLNDGYYEDENGDEAYKPGWCDNGGNIVDLEIEPGKGFWLKNAAQESQTMIGAGAVAFEDSSDVIAPNGIFTIMANVYPITVNLNDSSKVEFPDIVGVDYDEEDKFTATAPHIQIPGADGIPAKYYYLNDGYYEDENGDEAYKPGWCDNGGNLVDIVVEAQQGFWTKATTGNLKFVFKR